MDKNIRRAGLQSFSDVLEGQKRQTQLSINCVKIGTIQEFSPETQRANISVAYKQVKDILEDGTKVYQDYPLLMDCPVITLFGGVDFLSMPIQVGDSCLVFFNDNEIDQWATNGTGSPQTFRMHDLSDGIAIVGIRSLTNSIGRYLAEGIRLSHGEGNSEIDLKDDLIESVAELFLHHGDMEITRDLKVGRDTSIERDLEVKRDFYIRGDTYGDGGGTWRLRANLDQQPGYEIHDGRRVSGTFDVVVVVDGIVVGGSS